jgi:ribosomal subunit interface protein
MTAGVAAMAAAAVVVAARRATLATAGSQRPLARSFGREEKTIVEEEPGAWSRVEVEVETEVEEEAADADSSNVKVTLSTKHFDITPAIRDHVYERMDHVVERFGKNLTSLDAHLDVLRNPKGKDVKHSAELVAAVRPGYGKKTVYVRVKATSHDMYLSINDMTSQIERKVRQLKEKVTKGRKHARPNDSSLRSSQSITADFPGYTGPDMTSDLEEAVANAQTMAPMTLDEALDSFDVAEDDGENTDVFVFTDKKSKQVSVLYRDDTRSINLYLPKEKSVQRIY